MTFDPTGTILVGVPKSTLQQWLSAAQANYAALLSGGNVNAVSYDGKSVTYTQADRGALLSWITLLQRQLGIGRGRRALRPYF